jgi:crotonobetainyl-CoA hydratase
VTLNRPLAHNAVNTAVSLELGEALEAADKDPQVRAIVITGAGQKAFCAGADLKEARERPDRLLASATQPWGFAAYTNHLISKPTIAAVNGIALGGGTEIVLASDLAIAAEHASFGLPEVAHGIYAGGGGAIRLPRQIPPKVAMEMLLTGRTFSAADALKWGLVNRVVSPVDLLPTALSIAEQIASNSPQAVQATKRIARSIVTGRASDEDDAWRLSNDEGERVLGSLDALEGLRAFADKRAPLWS